MATENGGKRPAAVYIPFKTLLTSTEVLKQGVPKKLDSSAFPTFAGGMRSWTLSAYQFLGFTDKDGTVKPLLQQWIDADADGRANIMRALLTEKYAEVVKLAGEHGTPTQMRAEIEKLGVTGTTLQRAVKFFLDAAAFAGITVPAAWKKTVVAVGSTGARRKRRGAGNDGGRSDEGDDGGSGGSATPVLPAYNYPPVFNQALIRGLIETMPEPGKEWSEADQEQWIGLAKSIFRIVYKQPIRQLSQSSAVQAVAQ